MLEVEGAELATGEIFDSDTALGSVKFIDPPCGRLPPFTAVATAPSEEMEADRERSKISQHLLVIKKSSRTSGSSAVTVDQRHTPREYP